MDLSPYTGRWVALVGGQVTGVGYTPEEARQLAQRNRPKERVTLQFVAPPGGEELPLPALLGRLRPFFAQLDQPVYLVGGAVRDALLGLPVHDLDFVTPQRAIKLAFQAADALQAAAYVLDRERDTGRVVLSDDGMTLDFARFRGDDLLADLQDRDFTINAIALPVTAETSLSLIDPTGGLPDLRTGVIRMVHAQSLANDPVRALRAVRQAGSLGFQLAPETEAAVIASAPQLAAVSTERVRDELLKMLATAVPHQAVRQMHELGLLPFVLPTIAALDGVAQSPPHWQDVLAHTISALRWLVLVETAVLDGAIEGTAAGLSQAAAQLAPYRASLNDHFARPVDGMVYGRALLRLGALFHDVGKRDTQTTTADGQIHFYGHDKTGAAITADVLRRLTLSNKASDYVADVVLGHMRPLLLLHAQGSAPTRRAVYRYFRDIGAAGLDVGLLALADHLATYDGVGDMAQWEMLLKLVAALYANYFTQYAETVAPTPLLDGHDLMRTLDLKPGPEVGRLLRLLQEAQAAGEVNSRETAVQFVQQARR